jgi:hypothetical protein
MFLLVDRSEESVETAVEVGLEIARGLPLYSILAHTTDRVAELSEVEADKSESAVAIERCEKKTFPARSCARSHEYTLLASALMKSQEAPSPTH